MVFLDTCVWIELCGVRTPETQHEIRQATVAGNLIVDLLNANKKIITFQEQLLEVISAVQKVKMKAYNKECKKNSARGVSNIKEFRKVNEFISTKELCTQVCEDICFFSEMLPSKDLNIQELLDRIDVADLNDCIYYDYCVSNDIQIYTFDADYKAIDNIDIVHVL